MKAVSVVIAVMVVSLWIGGASAEPAPVTAFACGSCGWCAAGHTNPSGENAESEGIHSGCIAVAGCPHPDCVITFQTLPHADGIDRVLADAEAGDLEAPGTLVRRFGGSVVFNEQRGALQLRSPCVAGQFIGHIPLTTAQIERLAAEN